MMTLWRTKWTRQRKGRRRKGKLVACQCRERRASKRSSTIQKGSFETRYTKAESKDNPADQAVDRLIQSDVEFLDDARNTQCNAPHYPAAEHCKVDDAGKCGRLFPLGPIEGIVDVIGRLWNERDVTVSYILQYMLFCNRTEISLIVSTGDIPSTSLTVPSSESKSWMDFNWRPMLKANKLRS